jgi:uncharacterized protein (TIGR03382 family)
MKYVIAAALTAIPGIAAAHITLMDPPPRTTMEKNRHCGDPAAPRKTPKVYAPGATIMVKWLETIDHPGHFRISFDNDGNDFFVPPNATATTVGMDPTVMIDLIADVQGNFPIQGRMYMKAVTLPNIECTNCTLQVIQLMTDKPPYTTATSSDDIYYQCADIQLSNTAPPMVDAGVPPSGDAATVDPPAGEGGCSTGSGAGPAAALGLILLRRRRK